MKLLKLAFASLWGAIPAGLLYLLSCAIATFIENDYGTAVARALIYNTAWFDFLHLYLAITLIGCLWSFKTWRRKRYAVFILHLSLIVIILGAGVTRYFGFEGTMHIREGESSDRIRSSQSYINLIIEKEGQRQSFHIPADLIAGQSLSKQLSVFGEKLKLQVLGIQKLSKDKKDASAKMTLKLDLRDQSQTLELIGGIGIQGTPRLLKLQDESLFLSWGTRSLKLPFTIALKNFELQRYPGSMSPSSYASEVEVIEDSQSMPFRIYMNHTLDYGNYRFFQSSYDTDEQGTILSVNNDPGKNLSYLGYALLILGCLALLFDPKGRFRRLADFLRSQKVLSIALICSSMLLPSVGQENQAQQEFQEIQKEFSNLKERSKGFVKDFDSILVQDFGGRIKPINTLASDTIHKLTKSDNFQGFGNTQLFLGMMMMPDAFQQLKMIKVKNPALKQLLGIQGDYIAFREVFTPEGVYVLQNYVEQANLKKPSERNTFDKEVIAVDERINIAYLIYSGELFKIFPSSFQSDSWLQPLQAIQIAIGHGKKEEAKQIAQILQDFVLGFKEGITGNRWEQAQRAVREIKAYQSTHSPKLIPPATKVQAEIFLNQNNFFKLLILPYIALGVLLFGFVLFCILSNRPTPQTTIFYGFLALFTTILTLFLILRWYISGHAPWSNAYESMLYISWASSLSALLFFRKSALAIAGSLFLTGICLFVADLGFMDPQISNLVPVLKSYWLNIHVSIITASYGFLGLCFILGITSLILFTLRSAQKPQIDQSLLSLTAINEMTMMLGLFLLTVGNFLGGIWANESWGRYWGWDPKETWALISIGVYAIILHLRLLGIQNLPYVLALSSVLGFFSILMTYFGVNYYLSGMHSYAAGDPIPVPTFVYVLIIGITLLVLLAFPKRRLRFPTLKAPDTPRA